MSRKKRGAKGDGAAARGDTDASPGPVGVRGLLLTIWSGVALVVVAALYRAGRGDMAPGHWLAVGVILFMGVAITTAVVRDPGA